MELELLKDELEAVLRTLRLAQNQIALIKKKCKKEDGEIKEELESIEMLLQIILKKAQALTP